jgi:TolA-binding protein
MFGSNKEYVTLKQLQELLEPLEGRIKQLEDNCEAMQKQIDQLTLKLDEQELAHSEQPEEVPVGITLEMPTTVEGQSEAPASLAVAEQVLYLPAPSADGTFSDGSPKEEEGKSIYRLTTTDGEHGSFEMLTTSDAMATALISVSQFVKTVCRIEGNVHRMPQRVETLEPGTAKREGTVWRVVTKALVRFV